MLSARAPDADREVVAVLAQVRRNPGFKKRGDVVHHPAGLGVRRQKARDGFVAAGQGPQRRVVVGIRDAAHVEDEVGRRGDPVLVGEGFERDRHAGARLSRELLHPAAKLRGEDPRRVHDHAVFGHRLKKLGLQFHRFAKRERLPFVLGADREGVPPAGFRKALDELVRGGRQKEHPYVETLFAELRERLRHFLHRGDRTAVDRDRSALFAEAPQAVGDRQQKLRGEVVGRALVGEWARPILARTEGDEPSFPGETSQGQDIRGRIGVW